MFVMIPIALAFRGVANADGHIGHGDRDRKSQPKQPIIRYNQTHHFGEREILVFSGAGAH